VKTLGPSKNQHITKLIDIIYTMYTYIPYITITVLSIQYIHIIHTIHTIYSIHIIHTIYTINSIQQYLACIHGWLVSSDVSSRVEQNTITLHSQRTNRGPARGERTQSENSCRGRSAMEFRAALLLVVYHMSSERVMLYGAHTHGMLDGTHGMLDGTHGMLDGTHTRCQADGW